MAKLYEGVKPYDEAAVKASTVNFSDESMAFYLHALACADCSRHIKSMCDEGRRLLDLWAGDWLEGREK